MLPCPSSLPALLVFGLHFKKPQNCQICLERRRRCQATRGRKVRHFHIACACGFGKKEPISSLSLPFLKNNKKKPQMNLKMMDFNGDDVICWIFLEPISCFVWNLFATLLFNPGYCTISPQVIVRCVARKSCKSSYTEFCHRKTISEFEL